MMVNTKKLLIFKLKQDQAKLQLLREKLQAGEDSPLVVDFSGEALFDRLHKKHLQLI